MSPVVLIIGAVILAAILITLTPGGVFVAPVLLLAAIGWLVYRYVQGRRGASV